jgi:hypothetical protein
MHAASKSSKRRLLRIASVAAPLAILLLVHATFYSTPSGIRFTSGMFDWHLSGDRKLIPTDRLGVVPAAPPLPSVCINDLGFHKDEEIDCYFEIASQPESLCWGYHNPIRPAVPGVQHPPQLLFHTAALTPLPSGVPMMLYSFLATQCCDSVLWFWLLPNVSEPNSTLFALPQAHRHRIIWKRLDIMSEWAIIANDFVKSNPSTATAMSEWTDLRFTTDWYRLVLLYSYGGIWFDIDTIFLRDLRPMFNFSSFAYRAGHGLLLNNAVIKLAQREVLARHIIAVAIEQRDPRPDAISYSVIGVDFGKGLPGYNGTQGFFSISQTLFDFMWLRFVNEHVNNRFATVHPEFDHHWNSFFAAPTNSTNRTGPFLPGSYSYHWHNRYAAGIGPPGSWAAVLHARYKVMAEKKLC